jgi:hypothetical protein
MRDPSHESRQRHRRHAGDLRDGHQRNGQKVQDESSHTDTPEQQRADRHQSRLGAQCRGQQHDRRRHPPWHRVPPASWKPPQSLTERFHPKHDTERGAERQDESGVEQAQR